MGSEGAVSVDGVEQVVERVRFPASPDGGAGEVRYELLVVVVSDEGVDEVHQAVGDVGGLHRAPSGVVDAAVADLEVS